MKNGVIILVAAVAISALQALAQRPDIPIWEAHGVTSSEWKIALDSGISENKLSDILAVGMTVGEYLSHPWNRFGISEEELFGFLRRGLDEPEIIAEIDRRRNRPLTKLFNRIREEQ
jgi:hypothetical protein